MRTASYEKAVQERLLEMAAANSALRTELRLTRITLAAIRHALDGWPQDEVRTMLARIDEALKTTDGKVL